MTASLPDLLADLATRGVTVRLDGGAVKVRPWPDVAPAERELLRRERDAVRELLEAADGPSSREPEAEEVKPEQAEPEDGEAGVAVVSPVEAPGAPDGAGVAPNAPNAPRGEPGPPRAVRAPIPTRWPAGLDPDADRGELLRRLERRDLARLEPTAERVERFHLNTGDRFRDRPPDEQRSLTAAWLRECARWSDPNFRPERRVP